MVEFRKLDDRVPFARQLGESQAPIVWESVDAMRAAVTSPEFQSSMANYPPSSVASPHIFTKVAAEGICGS